MNKKNTILILFIVVYLISISNILACDWAPPQKIEDPVKFQAILDLEYKDAVAVFLGEVVELKRTTAKFKVEKVWKGDLKDEFTMSNGTRTLDFGLQGRNSCDYIVELNKKYLVFAFKSKYGDIYSTLPSLTDELNKAKRTLALLNKKEERQDK